MDYVTKPLEFLSKHADLILLFIGAWIALLAVIAPATKTTKDDWFLDKLKLLARAMAWVQVKIQPGTAAKSILGSAAIDAAYKAEVAAALKKVPAESLEDEDN